MSKLALLGGPRAIDEGRIGRWPPIDELDRRMVLESLESPTHVGGPQCRALEEEFAAWNGNRFVFNAGSGTGALHMCVAGIGLGAGDEVLCPAYSWPSSCMAVVHHQAIPVFVDIDFATINLDPSLLEAAVTPRTRAIMVVHLHGLAVDMEAVLEVAGRYDLRIIEDCAQGHGATFRGGKVGTFGDAAAFSCNQNKLLCGGEGGLFVTDDEEVLARGKALSLYADSGPPHDGPGAEGYALGYKYLGNDLAAAFARAQLTKLDGYLEQIAANAALLSAELAGAPGLILPTAPEGHIHNWYNFTLRFDMALLGAEGDPAGFRDKLVRALTAEGMPTAVWQRVPLPAMNVFQARNAYGRGAPWSCHNSRVDYALEQFPKAQRHCGCHTGMTDPIRPPNTPAEAKLLADAIAKVLEHAGELHDWEPT